MSTTNMITGPRWRAVPRAAAWLIRQLCKAALPRIGILDVQSRRTRALETSFRRRITAGETVYVLGLNPASHNTGAALVRCHRDTGIAVIANDEEERFRADKHCKQFPQHSLTEIDERLRGLGLTMADVHAVVCGWDYHALYSAATRTALEHFPYSLGLLREGATVGADPSVLLDILRAPRRLNRHPSFRGLASAPLIGLPHHDNHAYLAYGASPFARNDPDRPTLVGILDGFGDAGAISIYLATGTDCRQLYRNDSPIDSLGILYGVISSTQGGWPVQSSEGRYMGAAAWGNGQRLSNPYYRQLRQILHLGPHGEVRVNRALTGWQWGGFHTAYRSGLRNILGPPISADKMWHPDAILNVDNIQHAEITQDRVDKAAALQLVFEDGLTHLLTHWLQKTGAHRLVLAGGTALNCVANMRILDLFDETFYARQVGEHARLQLWVPPTPGDAGVAMGAAVQFAMRNGLAPTGRVLPTPYLCGVAPTTHDVEQAVQHLGSTEAGSTKVKTCRLMNIRTEEAKARLADAMATAIASGGVIGLFQGAAETGPRALGHRTILANPCRTDTLELLNAKVKRRERIRPLAPMVTLREAQRLFELSDGAAADDYDAYSYMVLTVRAKPLAFEKVPAVVHKDGTSRIQIVRKHWAPLAYALLEAMGRQLGVEACVNTSLNVGSPIVQTVDQAFAILERAKALDGLVIVTAEDDAYGVWRSATSSSEFAQSLQRLSQPPAEPQAQAS